MSRYSHKYCPPAFTLVELSVVLGVIAILLALLLPAISKAKVRANETVCLNNLRQIGIGIKLYQNDNDMRFPLRISEKGSTGKPPDPNGNRNDWRFFDIAIGGGDGTFSSPQVPRASERPLFQYVKATGTFRCPFDGGWDCRPEGELVMPTAFRAHGCSYQYNTIKTRRDETLGLEGLAGKPENWVPNPSLYILEYEPAAHELESGNGAAFLVFWHRIAKPKTLRRENGTLALLGNNRLISPILFVDGHTDILDFSQNQGVTMNTPEWFWFKPQN